MIYIYDIYIYIYDIYIKSYDICSNLKASTSLQNLGACYRAISKPWARPSFIANSEVPCVALCGTVAQAGTSLPTKIQGGSP